MRTQEHAAVYNEGSQQKCVLVVEDDPELARLLIMMLTRLGYRAAACSNGTEACDTLRATPQCFALGLLDLTLPDMAIEPLTHALRQVRHDLPLILLSGQEASIVASTMAALDMQAYLLKPYELQELTDILQRFMPTA